MAWVRLEDTFFEHPKVIAAGGDAAWLYLCGLGYCQRQTSGGRIPSAMVARLTDRRSPVALAMKLVEVGLWEVTESGWQVHDWHVYNDPEDEAKQRRDEIIQKRREAGRKGGQARVANAQASASSKSKQEASKPQASVSSLAQAPSHPIPSQSEDPPVSPASGGSATAPFGLVEAPKGRAKRGEKAAATRARHEANARAVLAALSDARIRVIEDARDLHPTDDNLKNITARLEAGATVEDCLHVIAVREAEVTARPESAQWFNAATPFTSEQFTRAVGMSVGDVGGAPAEPVPQAHRRLDIPRRPAS